MKTKLKAYGYLLFMPGIHRSYLDQPGWWYWLAILAIQVWAIVLGVAWIVKLGAIVGLLLLAWDALLIPGFVRECNDQPRIIEANE